MRGYKGMNIFAIFSAFVSVLFLLMALFPKAAPAFLEPYAKNDTKAFLLGAVLFGGLAATAGWSIYLYERAKKRINKAKNS